MHISALDVCPVWEGQEPGDALRASLRLASHVEELGYQRFWVAEHHAVANLATSSPTVLATAVAAVTDRIRVGTGGVMLNNHAAFAVAEQFATLAALHPGRIDAGVGRAAGGDKQVVRLLRGEGPHPEFEEQLRILVELLGPTSGGGPRTSPDADGGVPVFLLGASVSSARLAGELGLPFVFAHHIQPDGVGEAVGEYHRTFRSVRRAAPYAVVAARVVVADDLEQATALALPSVLGQVQVRATGEVRPFPRSVDPRYVVRLPAPWREFVEQRLSGHLLGAPAEVCERAERVVTANGADELMVLTMVPDESARLRSYELLAAALVPAHGRQLLQP